MLQKQAPNYFFRTDVFLASQNTGPNNNYCNNAKASKCSCPLILQANPSKPISNFILLNVVSPQAKQQYRQQHQVSPPDYGVLLKNVGFRIIS